MKREYLGELFSTGEDIQFDGSEFTNCSFRDLDLTGVDFSGSEFENCSFKNCNLSLVKFDQSRLNEVKFQGCKLNGVNFIKLDQLIVEMSFEESIISNCNFSGLEIPGTAFIDVQISDCDFVDSNLEKSIFRNVKFSGVLFHNCNLEKSSFYGSDGYSIDPIANRIKGSEHDLVAAVSFLPYLGLKLRK